MIKLPHPEKSLWRDFATGQRYPEMTQDLEVDVVIIGAGITGLSAAYFLSATGQTVAVLEQKTIGGGTTGRTTGKVTSQHNIIYDQLVNRHGFEKIKLYATANQSAIRTVEEIIKKEKIACDWAVDDHWVYTTDKSQMSKFRNEAKMAVKLGLPASFETSSPLPFGIAAAVKFNSQGKFNSQKYLYGLAGAVSRKGGYIFENSKARVIRGGHGVTVRTKQATVKAKNLVVATKVPTFPLVARLAYASLEYPTESYLIAAKFNQKLSGMYISPDDNHYSILPIRVGEKDYILIGGEGGNIPGIRLSKQQRYERLANYAANHFTATTITHKWSDMDYIAYDELPLIGQLYPWSKHVFTGSAYMKWGLTNGTVAGQALADRIIGKSSELTDAFTPQRFSPIANIPRVIGKSIFG